MSGEGESESEGCRVETTIIKLSIRRDASAVSYPISRRTRLNMLKAGEGGEVGHGGDCRVETTMWGWV